MKVVIIGSNGQLGSDLLLQMSDFHYVIGLTHSQIEVTDEKQVKKVLSEIKPDIVVNTSAYHNLPVCEDNPGISFSINATGALNLAKTCSELGALLIHYSTDYIFDGKKQFPYIESDFPNPLNIYGVSKFAGEVLVRNYLENHIIIRVSGIYGKVPCRAKGGNFIYNIVKASKEKKEIKVVNDEILTPTSTSSIAKNTLILLDKHLFGTFHMTCEGQCSWYEFTKFIFDRLKISTPLYPCSAKDFPGSIKRPLYSVLENQNLKESDLNLMPDWQSAVSDFLKTNL